MNDIPKWPFKYGDAMHQATLKERQGLITDMFENQMTDEKWIRLASLRGILDAYDMSRQEEGCVYLTKSQQKAMDAAVRKTFRILD